MPTVGDPCPEKINAAVMSPQKDGAVDIGKAAGVNYGAANPRTPDGRIGR
jgi:hypothetical protein